MASPECLEHNLFGFSYKVMVLVLPARQFIVAADFIVRTRSKGLRHCDWALCCPARAERLLQL
jgi:hypothetical protein